MDLQETRERINVILGSINDFSVRKAKLDERKNAATKVLAEKTTQLKELGINVEDIDKVVTKMSSDLEQVLTTVEGEVSKIELSLTDIEGQIN